MTIVHWNMATKMKIMENEKLILQDVKYGQKHSKTWKMKTAQQDMKYTEKH